MENISFDDFKKLDLRICKIISAAPVENSEKLLKLQVDIGDDSSTSSGQGKRQIIAGIAKVYDPKELVGKNFVVLANLKPKKLMGLESQGMILCAEVDGEPVCLSPLKDVPAGSQIR